jgi:lipopolysaccharide biosynthesis protein
MLLLANDSVFGPLYDPGEFFDAMRAEHADVWGITDSSEPGWHLQSYFLCVSRRARESRAFRDVFAQDFASFPDKRAIIDRGEIALSQALIRDGLTVRAYCPHERIAPRPSRGASFNPTYSAWDALIVGQRCPFLKRELFLARPDDGDEVANWRAVAEGRHIANWRAVVEGYTDYDTTLIDEYLRHAGSLPAHRAGGR